MRFNLFCGALLVLFSSPLLDSQQREPKEILAHAIHFAELYNWDDAGPEFTEAEHLFLAAGDKRNALYAKLGRIRSNSDNGQESLLAIAAELEQTFDDEPLLQTDQQLRLFFFIVKGDIDAEINAGEMKRDWMQVQALAQELGNAKWQYRALAQLGIAAFYDTDLETARKDAGGALIAATAAGDAGAQIRILTILADGLGESKMYGQALPLVDNAIKLASATPDTGNQFGTKELRIDILIGLGQLDAAQRAVDELLIKATTAHKSLHEATIYGLAASIAEVRKDRRAVAEALHQAITIGEAGGMVRLLSGIYAQAAEFYQATGDLDNAEHYSELSATATQASGNLWLVPEHLRILAGFQMAKGQYADADNSFERAEDFLDAIIGRASTRLEATSVITASSEIYAQHFALIADHLNDPEKAYKVIEQVRGRTAADLLASGVVTTASAKATERAISQLRLKLMAARSNREVANLRDEIFMEEQSRWAVSGSSALKANARETVTIAQVERSLPASAVLLEYVVAEPNSYCLTISRAGAQIVRLGTKARIEALVGAYLKAVESKLPAIDEARSLYDALLGPIPDASQKNTVIVVPDGQLNLIPFDALRDPSGHYVLDSRTVLYSPSAASYYVLTQKKRPAAARKALLAVGGIPYAGSSMNKSVLTRGFNRTDFADLPSSGDEVHIAQAAFRRQTSDILAGPSATEAAFKAASLGEYSVIHLAVHAFADSTFPDRAALVLLSDPKAGDDGFLQASEIAQMRFRADLVVLSACETAVGPLQGQDGIANLSRAFLMAGAQTVISTLWEIDDTSSLFLMKQFYKHLSMKQSAAAALTAAKRDMLRTYGAKAVPYQWAAFTIEGAAGPVLR